MRIVTAANRDETHLDGMVAELKARYERLAQAAEAAHADYVLLHGAQQPGRNHGNSAALPAGGRRLVSL